MRRQRATTLRTVSASEVARNIKLFETWSTFQGCEQVAFSDLPAELKADVTEVFDVDGKLPLSWVDETSSVFRSLQKLSPDLLEFLQQAYGDCPALFSEHVRLETCKDLLSDLSCVFLAWRQLQWMRKAKEKWSEADFAANVYNVFRSPAVRESAYRTQCSISLPQHLTHLEPTLPAFRVLRSRTVVPDSAIFIRASTIRKLSLSKQSPWKVLNTHPGVKVVCGLAPGSAFRYQTSPCTQPPDYPCFEFASCFSEDKKPNCELLEQAYRQNRMATASAARHLHSLRVEAPVFGLIWSNGTVRAHIDWCAQDGDYPAVLSAPYPGPDADEDGKVFHEWELDQPGDILSVFLLIRSFDTWTAGRFRERVEHGVAALVEAVTEDGDLYCPWKREEAALKPISTSSQDDVENTPPLITAFPTPPPQPRRKKPAKPAAKVKSSRFWS